jgi:hypothetical protein
MKSRVALIIVGVFNLLFGLLGFLDLYEYARSFHAKEHIPEVLIAVWTCNAIWSVLLLASSVMLIRWPFEGRKFSIRLLSAEIGYVLVFFIASWIAPHRIADAISAGFGIGAAGLTFQVLAGYPIWALIVLWLVKDRKVLSDYSDADSVFIVR